MVFVFYCKEEMHSSRIKAEGWLEPKMKIQSLRRVKRQ